MSARLLIGDAFARMAELPDSSVDLVMTSPPFLALRSYLPNDHPDKVREIGYSESSPAEFIDTLLDLAAAWRRVLAPHGSICVELGDTYAGSGGGGGDYKPGNLRSGQPVFDGSAYAARREWTKYYRGDATPVRRDIRSGWPLPKSLCGIPTLFAWSLAYGRNLLTGYESPAGQWRIRNLVHWVRPNPPVGALADKYRPATSYLVIACTSDKRWFDLDAVRAPATSTTGRFKPDPNAATQPGNTTRKRGGPTPYNPGGAPPLDWWKITAKGYKGSHYAVFPPDLVERPLKSMCPPRVCVECGQPSRRMVQKKSRNMGNYHPGRDGGSSTAGTQRTNYSAETLGWSDCCCGPECVPARYEMRDYPATYRDDGKLIALAGRERVLVDPGHCDETHWRRGVVLDPFAGSGTTLLVANDNGRDSIGIDIDARNAALAYDRVGPLFLDVDYGISPNDLLMDVA